MAQRACQIVGWGKCVPDKVVTNHDLARTLDTSDEWILERTGIRERRVAAAADATSTLAVRAARAALAAASLPAALLDLIIVTTVTPDYPVPATACLVQDALGAAHAGAFDLAASCSGFVYALAVASQMIQGGAYQNILVIGPPSPRGPTKNGPSAVAGKQENGRWGVKKAERSELILRRARECARSGDYKDWYAIEIALRDQGFREPRSVFDNSGIRPELDAACRSARRAKEQGVTSEGSPLPPGIEPQ